MPLTDAAIKNAKPSRKPVRIFDAGGLYLEVAPSGGKWWRRKFRYQGKEKRLSVGIYPDVSLRDARERRDELRKLLSSGVDPSAHRKAEKSANEEASANSFEMIAREWLTKRTGKWEPVTSKRKLERLERDVFPAIGTKPIASLSAATLLPVLRRIEARGAHEVAKRVRQALGPIFRYAIATGRADRDPAADLKDALEHTKETHRAALTKPHEVGALLRAIHGFQGEPTTRAALQLAPLVFVRPGELRAAEWAEFDILNATWRIPASRMKMREEHIVPLSRQAVSILRELQQVTGGKDAKYLFPSMRTRSRCMSENTVNAALRRLGYSKDEMTGHGFRSIASTLLHEHGQWSSEIIERQLAHGERNKVKAAYNRAQHLTERRKMMQWWSDYLDTLRDGAEIIRLPKKA